MRCEDIINNNNDINNNNNQQNQNRLSVNDKQFIRLIRSQWFVNFLHNYKQYNHNNNSELRNRHNDNVNNSYNNDNYCANCGQSSSHYSCSRCQQVYYCAKECQVTHWKTHKLVCSKLIDNVDSNNNNGVDCDGNVDDDDNKKSEAQTNKNDKNVINARLTKRQKTMLYRLQGQLSSSASTIATNVDNENKEIDKAKNDMKIIREYLMFYFMFAILVSVLVFAFWNLE